MSCHNTLEKAFTWRKKRVEYLISEDPLSYLKHGPHYLSSTQLLFFEQCMYLSAPIRTQRKKKVERSAVTEPQARRAADLNGLKEGWADMLSTKPGYSRKEKIKARWLRDGGRSWGRQSEVYPLRSCCSTKSRLGRGEEEALCLLDL